MNAVSQILGALIEAWGEVKVQKTRVILSLVGVVAAVAAMTIVIALGDLLLQSSRWPSARTFTTGRVFPAAVVTSSKLDRPDPAGNSAATP